MRMHGRDVVALDALRKPDGRRDRCGTCQSREWTELLTDRLDPSWIVCEACWLAWDVAQSGMDALASERARSAFSRVACGKGRPMDGPFLASLAAQLRRVDQEACAR